jgi:RND family efflux transporter MFP subunit
VPIKTKVILKRTGALLLLLGSIALYFHWTTKTALVARAFLGTATDTVAANFTVREKHLSRLTARNMPVTVKKVHFEIGDLVKQNSVLIDFNESTVQLKLDEAIVEEKSQKELMALKSPLEFQLSTLELDLPLAETRHKRGMMSQKEFADYKISIEETKAEIEREDLENEGILYGFRNKVMRQELYLDRMTLVSPQNGVVYDILKREGEVAKPWEPVMDLIYDEKSVVADVPEKDIERLKVGDSCLLKFLAYRERTFPGTITYILPKQNPLMKTFDVYVKADIPHELLIPGLNGEASFQLGQRTEALLVPNQALMNDELLLVGQGGLVTLKKVTTGYRGLIYTEILEGIEEGDRVIIKELTRYPVGSVVRTKEP